MKKIEYILYGILFAGLVVLSKLLLAGDATVFWTWWLLALVLGILGLPLSGRLFFGFDDKGWMFSKVLAIAISGYLEWLLVSMKAIPFTTGTCAGIVILCGIVSMLAFSVQSRKGFDCTPSGHWGLIMREELLFFAAFLIWTYLAGFNAAAYGTEKFMDYGFMEAMMRSSTLPARDLWYSQGTINYYYGGQYFAVFLTKLSTSRVELTYNLMRTFVAGLAVALPFSLVRQMLADRLAGKTGQKGVGVIPELGGLTAGIAVTFAGNVHYVWYAVIAPLLARLRGEEASGYWFPDATRYIGYNPDVPDKTIHEFPSYSFILGDLHAHVVNIMFVLLLVGVLYAWLTKAQHSSQKPRGFAAFPRAVEPEFDPDAEAPELELTEREDVAARIAEWMEAPETEPERRGGIFGHLLNPWILTAAFLLGLYKLNNFWDFVIYMVVAAGTALFLNIIENRKGGVRILGMTLLQTVWMFALSSLVALPFTVQFDTMVDGVALAKNHSLPHQLLILWGLPFLLGLLFLICMLRENLRGMQHRTLGRLMDVMKNSDLFALLLFFCAFGLVLIPELVYVRDIYENGNARANTMFKLTYQAYILFAMMMGYVIWRLLALYRSKAVKVLAGIGLFFLCWTVGYFGRCVKSWYSDVTRPDFRAGLDAVSFLEDSFSEDVEAIYWLKDNVGGSPVVLEANGDSYTDYQRVSAMTGLPTVLGWYVHEWLWRGDPADLNEKSSDVEAIYTSENEELVSRLLQIYDVSYIFVGSTEWDKYGDRINYDMLDRFGTVVFSDLDSGARIYEVNQG